MERCYLCGLELCCENRTTEHIIPNSIGGRLKSKAIICSKCNVHCGQKLDSVLGDFGKPIALQHNIKLDRGKLRPLVTKNHNSKEIIKVQPGGSTRILEPWNEKYGDGFYINCGSKKRLCQEVERLKKKAREEGKVLDVAEPYRIEVCRETREITYNVDVDMGIALRAAAKTISSYYYYASQEFNDLVGIRNYIMDGGVNDHCWMCNLRLGDMLYNSFGKHILYVHGNEAEKILYGYFEIFGAVGFLCILNRDYDGIDFRRSYAYDTISRGELKCSVDLSLPRTDIIEYIAAKKIVEYGTFVKK